MRRLLLVGPVLLLALGAGAACGDDGSNPGIATIGGEVSDDGGAAQELGEEERRQAFVECLRENGIDMPDPEPGGDGRQGGLLVPRGSGADREELRVALEACRDLMPNGGRLREPDREQLERMREFARCMRDNGIDMPDPDPNGGPGALAGVDPGDPEFQEALEACQDVFGPGGGPRLRTGPGGDIGGQSGGER